MPAAGDVSNVLAGAAGEELHAHKNKTSVKARMLWAAIAPAVTVNYAAILGKLRS